MSGLGNIIKQRIKNDGRDKQRAMLSTQPPAAQEGWRDAATSALRFIEANAEHDQRCDVFDLDENGRHKGCNCGLEDAVQKLQAMLAAAPAVSESPVQWPQERDVGRIGDMSKVASLRVGLDADSDVYVCIHGEAGSGSVEFCVSGSGGGKSPRTRAALISLMVAMEADNAETPSREWWKAREGDAQKGGAA